MWNNRKRLLHTCPLRVVPKKTPLSCSKFTVNHCFTGLIALLRYYRRRTPTRHINTNLIFHLGFARCTICTAVSRLQRTLFLLNTWSTVLDWRKSSGIFPTLTRTTRTSYRYFYMAFQTWCDVLLWSTKSIFQRLCLMMLCLCCSQVKNIIYHAVKDAVGTLKAHEPKIGRS